jgi:uncharacterized protein (DUF885 family)
VPDFETMLQELLEEEYAASPVLASGLGLTQYDGELDDLSEVAIERQRRQSATWLTTFEAISDDGLSFDQRIDRGLVVATLEGRGIMDDWQMWRRQPANYLNPGLNGVFGLFLHRLTPESELARAATARLRAMPGNLADGKKNLDPELAPRVYIERGIGQARAGARYVSELVAGEVRDERLRTAVAEAGHAAGEALEDFARFLEGLLERARGAWAIGEQRYSALLKRKEMLGYGARELRNRGRAEFDRVAEELRRCAREIAGTDDWKAVLRDLNRDHPPTPEAMREAYADWTARARQFLAERRLVTFPEGEACEVEPSPPFQRPLLAVASYNSPPAFSDSVRGHFFVPYPPDGTPEEEVQRRLETNSYATIPTVAVHEAYPGHHWHLTAVKDNRRAVRHVFRTPYFSEGWGLYAERMMREEGFFTDPRQEMSQYEATIFRAARIVVDTSLHMGEMGFEEAVAFMVENANLTEPTARAEVGRYCTWPTQASSYLTGCLEIVRIRERYLRENGLAGVDGLRQFHDAIARSGSLPIALAERAVMEGALS